MENTVHGKSLQLRYSKLSPIQMSMAQNSNISRKWPYPIVTGASLTRSRPVLVMARVMVKFLPTLTSFSSFHSDSLDRLGTYMILPCTCPRLAIYSAGNWELCAVRRLFHTLWIARHRPDKRLPCVNRSPGGTAVWQRPWRRRVGGRGV